MLSYVSRSTVLLLALATASDLEKHDSVPPCHNGGHPMPTVDIQHVPQPCAGGGAVGGPVNADGTPFIGGPGDPGYEAAVARGKALAAAHGAAGAAKCPTHKNVKKLPAGAVADPEEQKALAKHESKKKVAAQASGQVVKAQKIEVNSKKDVHQAKLDHDAKVEAVHAQAKHVSAKALAVKAKALEMEGRTQDRLALVKKASAKSEKAKNKVALKARAHALAKSEKAFNAPGGTAEDAGMAAVMEAAKHGVSPKELGRIMKMQLMKHHMHPHIAAHLAGFIATRACLAAPNPSKEKCAQAGEDACRAAGGDDDVVAAVRRAGGDVHKASAEIAKRAIKLCLARHGPPSECMAAAARAVKAAGGSPQDIGRAMAMAAKATGGSIHIAAHMAGLHAAQAARAAGDSPCQIAAAAAAAAKAAGGDASDIADAKAAGACASTAARLTALRAAKEDKKAGKSPYSIALHAACCAKAMGGTPEQIGKAVAATCRLHMISAHICAHVAALSAAKAARAAGMCPAMVAQAAMAAAKAAGGDAADIHDAKMAGANAQMSLRLAAKRSAREQHAKGVKGPCGKVVPR